MIWTLSPQQEQRIRELIPACCNWEQGHCLPLDIPCLPQPGQLQILPHRSLAS